MVCVNTLFKLLNSQKKLVNRPKVSKLTALPEPRKLHSLINASDKNVINL